MKLGIVGLGRMGAPMARRLVAGGHPVTGYDPLPSACAALSASGVPCVDTLAALCRALPSPRLLWLMIPAGAAVDETLLQVAPLLGSGDVIIDGGNSHYADSQRRALALADRQVHYLDCGTSGGVWGEAQGYSLMIGGHSHSIEALQPLWQTLAPTPETGWGRVGPSGAGHYCKMVHNGIEYGLMQAYAEGFALLRHKPQFSLDLHQVADIWRHGSVVRSWLLDLAARALAHNPALDGIAPHVADSGEGRWAVAEAIGLNLPAPVITAALIERLRSRDDDSYPDRLLSALRQQFGGHAVQAPAQPALAAAATTSRSGPRKPFGPDPHPGL